MSEQPNAYVVNWLNWKEGRGVEFDGIALYPSIDAALESSREHLKADHSSDRRQFPEGESGPFSLLQRDITVYPVTLPEGSELSVKLAETPAGFNAPLFSGPTFTALSKLQRGQPQHLTY